MESPDVMKMYVSHASHAFQFAQFQQLQKRTKYKKIGAHRFFYLYM